MGRSPEQSSVVPTGALKLDCWENSHHVLFTLKAFTNVPHSFFAALCVETGGKKTRYGPTRYLQRQPWEQEMILLFASKFWQKIAFHAVFEPPVCQQVELVRVWALRTRRLQYLSGPWKILISNSLFPQGKYTHTESWTWCVFPCSSYWAPQASSKLSLIISMLYMQRQCAAGTQGQSSHFHIGCPRAAFPGHSLVTPLSPVRLSLAAGNLNFILVFWKQNLTLQLQSSEATTWH